MSSAPAPSSSSAWAGQPEQQHEQVEHKQEQQQEQQQQQQEQQPQQEQQQQGQQQQEKQQEEQQQQAQQQLAQQQQEQQQQQQQQEQQQQQQQQEQQQQPQQEPAAAPAPASTTDTGPSKTRVIITLDYNDMAGAITADDSFEAACEKAGKNVGNLVWLYSASKYMMDLEKNTVMSPKTRKGELDAVIIPSANILWNMSDLDSTPNKDAMMASFATMQPTTTDPKPRFIIGIGVKGYEGLGTSTSDLHGDLGEVYIKMFTPNDYILHNQYITTLSAIGKGAKAIGVRGPFTEKLLHNYGVSEAAALGCPSLFLNPTPNLGAIIQEKIAALGPTSRVAINMPQRWLPRLMTFLLRMAMESKDHVVIWQSPTDYWFLKRAEKELGITVPPEKIHWFRDFESWSDFMCKCDAIVGSRIHGNMIGVSCPTPMLLIASDIRTHEMGQGMKIPMLQTDHSIFQDIGPKLDNTNATVKLPSLAELFKAAKFDGAAFDKNRYLQASRYNRILTGMKIVPSERIQKLAALNV